MRPSRPNSPAAPVLPQSAGSVHEREQTGLPVLPPLTALAEIAILFALIYGIDRLTPNLAILDVSPHPFWIPVLLVSLQYGTMAGLIAAAVAIGLSLFAGLPEQDIGENLFAYFLRVWGQPILWIGVALLVGQFRMRQLAAKLELRHQNEALLRQRDDLARHSGELRARVERLEQDLVTRYVVMPHTAAAVLAQVMSAGGLGSDEDGARRRLEAIREAVAPDAVLAAYRLQDGSLEALALAGGNADAASREHIAPGHALHTALIAERRALSVLDADGQRTLAGAGLAALPILSADGQAAVGALIVESADPALISEDGLAALCLVAHALGPHPLRADVAAAIGAGKDPAARIGLKLRRAPIDRPNVAGVVPAAVRPPAVVAAKRPAGTDRRSSLMALLARAGEGQRASVTIAKPGGEASPGSATTTEPATRTTTSGAAGE